MQFFINERMVEIIDDVYCITNFMKYQNQDGLEKIREQNRLRKQKQREKLRMLGGMSRDMSRDVTEDVTQCHATEEEEEKEKEEEIHSFILSREEERQKLLGGSLGGGVVMLSDEQFNDLCDNLSFDELNKYIGIVRDCELSGQKYKKKTHYQAILDMVKKDRKVGKG
jgi:hypothetical protein